MSSDARHFHEELQDFVDGRLPEAARKEVEEHVSDCPDCRGRLHALSSVKAALAGRRGETPAGLEAEVLSAIARSGAGGTLRGSRRYVIAGLAAAAALAAIAILTPTRRDLPEEAARSFSAFRGGRVVPQRVTSAPAELEAYFREVRPRYTTRVFDFGMMGWRLVGGSPSSLGKTDSSLFVYVSPDGRVLVCQMYAGREEDLPPPQSVHEQRGFTFRIYERDGLAIIFWKEAGAMCVLVSDLPPSEALPLAVAKAA